MPALRLLALCLLSAAVVASASAPATPTPAQQERASRIVAGLGLADAAKAARVTGLIARQYLDLSVIHEARDARLHALRQQPVTDKAAHEAALKAAHDDTLRQLAPLHADYLARLAAELTPPQVDQVKDGMTYGVLPLTFRVYQEMLPNLTAEQKDRILAWLTEARELAMDASTSEEKHAWFGKYKGRINNYLAQAGIDLKQAEKDMLARKAKTKDQRPKD